MAEPQDETEGEAAEIAALVAGNDATGLAREIMRLRGDCAEAYQAVGFLVDRLGYWDNLPENEPRQEAVTKLLDNLSAAADGEARMHDDLIPFGWAVEP